MAQAAPISLVERFLTRSYPAVLTALIDYVDELRDAGQVTTLDELRAELVKLALVCREYPESSN